MGKKNETRLKTLTVYKKYTVTRSEEYETVPEIRLSGKWLEKIDFFFGKKVGVLYGKDRIVIINTEKKLVIL